MAGPSGATPNLTLPYPVPGDNVDVPRDLKALADKLDVTVPVISPVTPMPGCYITGVTSAAVGGAWRPPNGGSVGRVYPAGAATGAAGFTVPSGEGGKYLCMFYARLDNMNAGKQGGIRGRKNGVVYDSPGTVRIYNALAAQYVSGTGWFEADLNAGDVFFCEVFHDDTAARTITWRLRLEKIRT